ncbi:DUF6082 family protein [Streptomyces fulvoviolaceus]|uniref:DUF6082 family protein n=1 Tax=Streptomyces fulvoviolaceus TaxID=285535 RepID=UPI00131DFA7D|nr:DUF6082 family protein [Streptomyces fulvoviolaceus]
MTLLFVAALLAAPFILISDTIQAFSAASVLMSGMALTGVAGSLFYQAQQTKVVRDERDRATHREMIYLAMEDRDLAACWEPPDVPMTFERYRQVIYTNLIMGRWHAAYLLGDVDASTLRYILDQHFRGEIGRLHWRNARNHWPHMTVGGRKAKAAEFAAIVEEGYQTAMEAGPAVAADGYFDPDGPRFMAR